MTRRGFMNMTSKLTNNLAKAAPKMSPYEKEKQNSMKALRSIPTEAYNKCVENWTKRWHDCIAYSLKAIIKTCIKINETFVFYQSIFIKINQLVY